MAQKDNIRLSIVHVEHNTGNEAEPPMTAFSDAMRAGRLSTIKLIPKTAGYAIAGSSLVSAAINTAGMPRSTADSEGQGISGFSGTVMTDGASIVDAGAAAMLSGAGQTEDSATGYLGGIAARATAGDSAAQTFLATQQMQELNQQFSLRYLQLQANIQAESRWYTAISNIMKAKYDTAKNIISNLK